MKKLMMTVKMAAIVLCSSVIAYNIQAGPAFNKSLTHLQSNRTTLTYYLMGDEYVHWAKTTDGYTLLRNQAGIWCMRCTMTTKI